MRSGDELAAAAELDAELIGIVERVTRRLRAARRVGRTVTLRLRFDDFSRATRSQTLLQATAQTRIVLRTARELLTASAPLIRDRGLTLIGLTVSNLADDLPLQLALPLEAADTELLDAVLDEIRERFGPTAVTRAVLLAQRRLEMPLLPD